MNSATIHSKSSISEQLVGLSPIAELAFLKALPHADDYGRIRADAVYWALHVAPGRLTTASAKKAIAEIHRAGLIKIYASGGKTYAQIDTWFEHQEFRSDYRLKSTCPNPQTHELEINRTYKDAQADGITKARPKSSETQPKLIDSAPPRLESGRGEGAGGERQNQAQTTPHPASRIPHSAEPTSSEPTPVSIDQLALNLLTLSKKENSSLSTFFPEGKLDAAAVEKHLKANGANALWDVFTAIYPETAHGAKIAPAKLLLKELAAAGQAATILKGAYRYGLYVKEKSVAEDRIFGHYTFLCERKFEDTWVDLAKRKPVAGIDYVTTFDPGESTGYYRDLATGERFDEQAWRQRQQEFAA